MRIETKLIHAGELEPRPSGAVSMPIFQSSTFEYTGERDYHDLQYIRLNNTPNHIVLHKKLAALEVAEAALVTGSGMAAISSTLLALLESGDHLLAHECLYGGSHDFFTKDLPKLGISCTFIDADRPDSWMPHLTPRTRMIYVETITNPLLQVVALDDVVSFAKKHRLFSVIDNTLATPINFRPIERGFDLVLHSATKMVFTRELRASATVLEQKDEIIAVLRKRENFHISCFVEPERIKAIRGIGGACCARSREGFEGPSVLPDPLATKLPDPLATNARKKKNGPAYLEQVKACHFLVSGSNAPLT